MLCPADLTPSTHFLRFVQSSECEWIAVLRVTRGTHQFSLDFLSKWLEMSCSQKEPRVRIPNSPPKSPVNKRVCRTFLFCSFAQNRLKTMERTVRFLERTRRFSAFWRIRTEKNQFFPSSAEISAHLLPKFTDSGSAIPLTIAFAEDSFEV